MSRQFYVNGATMVAIKGNASTPIAQAQYLGLPADRITCTPKFNLKEIDLDAWGNMSPAEFQQMLAEVTINMTLIHYDPQLLQVCIAESMGGTGTVGTEGTLPQAGTLMGGNVPLYTAGNHYITVGLYSPIGSIPWTFLSCVLQGNLQYPLGTEKSVVSLTWRCIPYTTDPWNNGLGAQGQVLWNHTLLTQGS